MKITVHNNDTSFVTFCNEHKIELEIHVPDPGLTQCFIASIKNAKSQISGMGVSQLHAINNLVARLAGCCFLIVVNGEEKRVCAENMWVPDTILCTETVVLID